MVHDRFSTPYKALMSDGIYLMEEVQEKKVLLTFSVDNTIALEKLRDKYPGKLLNELINIGLKNVN